MAAPRLLLLLLAHGSILAAATRSDDDAVNAQIAEAVSAAVKKSSVKNDAYSTNAICTQFNCINPIVPGISDLQTLANTTWQCQDVHSVKKYMSFCKNALYYDPGVPSPKTGLSLEEAVTTQDNAASTMYFYALSGMNLEPWAHRQPWMEQDSCLTSVWKTVCNTYFPRAEAGCKAGEQTQYLRPCKNVCENYLSACSVQCCDESVQCVFKKEVSLLDGKSAVVSGYHHEEGPSAMCTGDAAPQTLSLVLMLVLLSLTQK